MRKIISLVLLAILLTGIIFCLGKIPFGNTQSKVRRYYVNNGIKDTGATNIVTSVVLNYRGLDTLGEVTILFIAAIGLSAVLHWEEKRQKKQGRRSSLILYTGCRFLFPLIMLFGAYIFIHGHLTPGGGFQGGAIIASGFLLTMLGCWKWQGVNKIAFKVTESIAGIIFVVVGLLGLLYSGYFLANYLPKGLPNQLFSAGIIPIIYVAIGFKVGTELSGVLDNLIEEP
ncbi:cation:proton antiporter [candidate division WOR_3 bacterium SM1_77]|uniref:Cation:proton antiporter n=1 Tax=candidate division WOR_3 bacterium SM1_77 TaxID=1703778 RepID=A0A0S8K1A4_UNCW3|nr:MAG: cation:proton antiporter [candidate division WOR_3 bacterium SM1_77]